MSIDIGKFKHRIAIQTRADTKDANGGQIGVWSTVGTVWASVRTLTGRKLELARQIDAEVKAVIQESHERVRTLLQENRPTLDALAAKLEEKEVLSGEEVEAIVKKATA